MAVSQIIVDPVISKDGSFSVRTEAEQILPLLFHDKTPVTSFVPGWHPTIVYTGLPSFLILEFHGPGQSRGVWIIDRAGRRLAGDLLELQHEMRERLRQEMNALYTGNDPAGPDDGFRLLTWQIRRDLLGLTTSYRGPTKMVRRSQTLQSSEAFTTGRPRPSRVIALETRLPLVEGEPDLRRLSRAGGRFTVEGAGGTDACVLRLETARMHLGANEHALIELLLNGDIIAVTEVSGRWQGRDAFWTYHLPSDLLHGDAIELELRCPVDMDIRHLSVLLGASVSPAAVPAPAELLGKFESVGDNCEFGLVQRHFGTEPLGLLRFMGADSIGMLLEAIRDRFRTFGTAGTLRAFTVSNGEYWIRDDHYRMQYHTFRFASEVSSEEVLAENEAKLAFLKRKFIEDMEDGEKIFVFKRCVTDDVNEMFALHDVLREFNRDNKLLWVTECDDEHLPSDVNWVAPNLLRGYTSLISRTNAHDFDPQVWLRLCRNAHAVFSRSLT